MKQTRGSMIAMVSAVLLMALAQAGHMGDKAVSSIRRSVHIRGHRQDKVDMFPKVEAFPHPFNIEPKRCVTGFYHVGCVNNVQLKQQRKYRDIVPKEDRQPMTIELCWNFCKNVSGVQFFSLRRGDRCTCLPYFDDNHDYADEMCDQPCDGNPGQMCGGLRLQDMYEMHDCNNLPPVPCKRPPAPVANAKVFDSKYYRGMPVPCSNAVDGPLDTVTQSLCAVECNPGYYLAENTLACVEEGDRLVYSWAQVKGTAVCKPVSCGTPEHVAYSTYPKTEHFYTEEVGYTCSRGYSLAPDNVSDSQMEVACLANQSYETHAWCVPVSCGECPTEYPNATAREAGTDRVRGDTCTFDCEEGFSLNQRYDGVKQFQVSCLSTGTFSAPQKCLPVICGAAPSVAKAHVLTSLEPGAQIAYPQSLKYECEFGYTLDADASGEREFLVSCLSNASFSKIPECKPVSNGHPPEVNDSDYVDIEYFYGDNVTYTCNEGYTLTGKADGDVQSTIQTGPEGHWLQAAPQCLPIECGPAPSIDHASLNGTAPELVTFASAPLHYVCHGGYSTHTSDDIWNPHQAAFLATCQANGNLTKKECVNIDDCLIRNCGAHGECVDSPSPTGVPIDDYTCKCQSGYEITLHESDIKVGEMMKRCTNIMDCPTPVEEACGGHNAEGVRRGMCTDLVSNYSCFCGAGYENTFLQSHPTNETCTPISCGVVAAVGNATCLPDMVGKEANYDTPEWEFTCTKGYTLDGTVEGAKTFDMSCGSTGDLTAPQTCKPVSCGPPMTVLNADVTPQKQELVYGEQVLYTCDAGHALEGDAEGLREFEVECLSTGEYSHPGGESEQPVKELTEEEAEALFSPTHTTTPMSCLPVSCGVVPEQQHSTWNTTRKFVYGEAATVVCDDGYSVDASTSPDSDSYKAHCLANGSYKILKSCTRIKCEAPPEVDHSSHEPEGPFYYEDSVTYTMDPGYTIDVPGVGKINGTFTCHCTENGKFNGTCAADVESSPIDCGAAPTVEHATVTGETHFGGTLLAVAHEGYSVDGLPHGQNNFTFFCQANGRFSPRQEFQRITCGLSPEHSNVEEMEFTDAGAAGEGLAGSLIQLDADSPLHGGRSGLKIRRAPNTSLPVVQLHTRRLKRKSIKAFYGDKVHYYCEEGFVAVSGSKLPYPVVSVSPEESREFEVICTSSGDFEVLGGNTPADTTCVPVSCEVTKPSANASYDPVFVAGVSSKLRSYTEKHQYTCHAGYNLDGTPTGEAGFEESCLSSGQMSKVNACKDINWCLVSQCGPKGNCSDGSLSYSCSCDPGYEVTLIDSGLESCTEIDECITLDGTTSCAVGGGNCTDNLLGYNCTCSVGYENTLTSNGHDSCQKVMCPVTPIKAHAFSEKEGQKLSYEDQASYTCDTGYTTDSTTGGPTTFTMKCGADKKLTNNETECQPLACPEAQPVANSTILGSPSAHYGQAVNYTCDIGHSTTGTAQGSKAFQVHCLATGRLSAAQSCLPVSCGAPTALSSATFAETPGLTYSQAVTYTCVDGYTLDGLANGSKTFEVACEANGTLSGLQDCLPVSCGSFEGVDDGQSSAEEQWYPSTFPVFCDAGYTVDGTSLGESNFMVKCGTNGRFENVSQCQPVSCGVPNNTEAATTQDGAKVYMETATWTCKAGYSLTGRATGGTTFQMICGAQGSYTGAPNDCIDIDYCHESPCSNGVCTDSGAGVPYPGYTCKCHEGFNMELNSDGSQRCSSDDCADKPCGAGGTCHDLSKSGGPEGAYTCECDSGYTIITPESGGQTCMRVSCGTLPTVDHTEQFEGHDYQVATWKGSEAIIDPLRGQPELQSFDVATYTCATGYSTDGSINPEAKTFSVECESYGNFSRALEPEAECQPVVCEEGLLPVIAHAAVASPKQYVFGEQATFHCAEGYTLNGLADGLTSFPLACKADGHFAPPSQSCIPISCPVPALANATVPITTLTHGAGTAQYTCITGHYLFGFADPELQTFSATCGLDGQLHFTGRAADAGSSPSCEPVVCQELPDQPNAVAVGEEPPPAWDNDEMMMGGLVARRPSRRVGSAAKLRLISKAKSSSAAGQMVYGQVRSYQCEADHTLGGVYGGDTSYDISCQADGRLTGQVTLADGETILPGGPPAEKGICQPVGLTVQGVVTDAENAAVKIPGAKVSFWQGGVKVAEVYADDDGLYSASIPQGETTIRAEHSDYITREKGPFSIMTPVRPGQFADIALSRPLGADEWRMVLSWGASPADLDSHIYFGCDLERHVSVQSGSVGYSDRAGGVHVSLDRDAAMGYGPETTTIKKSGNCTQVGCCLIKYKVHHFIGEGSAESPSLSSSEAVVTIYQGAKEVGKYHVPTCLGDETWWTVLTIDATSGQNELYVGDKARAPYITPRATGQVSWATSFDVARWSLVATPTNRPAVIKGLNMLDTTRLHHLEAASYYEVKEAPEELACQAVSWTGTLAAEEWAQCPAGTYLAGLYRTGSKYDGFWGIEQLAAARCCSLEVGEEPPEWPSCHTQSVAAGTGWFECQESATGLPTVMVGLHASKMLPGSISNYDGPSPKHGTTQGGVYIGGEYIELGFPLGGSDLGKMGTTEHRSALPSGFTGRASEDMKGIGYLGDVRGFSSDPEKLLLIDYFNPGVKEEGFYVGFTGSGGQIVECKNCASEVTDTTPEGGHLASVRSTATLTGAEGSLHIIQDVTVGYYDKFFKTTITLKNTGTTSISNVRYMRSVDPDNDKDQGGYHATWNQVLATVAEDGYAAVSAESLPVEILGFESPFQKNNGGVGAVVVYFTDDPRAKGSFDIAEDDEWEWVSPTEEILHKDLEPEGIYDPKVYDSPPPRGWNHAVDGFISICFDVGTMAPGEETTMYFLTALDARPMTEVIDGLREAVQPVLTLDKAKCCAVAPQPLREGDKAC